MYTCVAIKNLFWDDRFPNRVEIEADQDEDLLNFYNMVS